MCATRFKSIHKCYYTLLCDIVNTTFIPKNQIYPQINSEDIFIISQERAAGDGGFIPRLFVFSREEQPEQLALPVPGAMRNLFTGVSLPCLFPVFFDSLK